MLLNDLKAHINMLNVEFTKEIQEWQDLFIDR